MEAAAPAVPETPWPDFCADFHWRQGEHLTAVGPTRSGKTTLVRELLAESSRRAQVVFSHKRRDPAVDALKSRRGFVEIPSWTVSDAELMPRVILKPRVTGFDSVDQQRAIFRQAMDSIYRQGGWCVFLDDARFLTDQLGLKREAEMLIQLGRSEGITVVSAIQRPRHVPLVMLDQAPHLFFFRSADETMLRRLGELVGAADPEIVKSGIGLLDSHSLMYANTETGAVARTRVPADRA